MLCQQKTRHATHIVTAEIHSDVLLQSTKPSGDVARGIHSERTDSMMVAQRRA